MITENSVACVSIDDVFAIRDSLVRVAFRHTGNPDAHVRVRSWQDADDAVQLLFCMLLTKPEKWLDGQEDVKFAYKLVRKALKKLYKRKSARQQSLDEQEADRLLAREPETVLYDVIGAYMPDEQALMNGLATGYSHDENMIQLGWSNRHYFECLSGIRVKGLLYTE